ncbi:2-hydroxychromene-2-carboxylate isomerase [Duganella callida]|uniref:2-hydroxychromene-2-carboxylate isomerase n=1 Tax=Duganella callida TaxID=2561932 RepID=A0A4Y9S6I7_9BURK|nr:2-hydroxychromene-2-carboxylate isomerase [Duganella callida]TFW17044.1 2-hydroxychromene-2-carboxylate isomerase [Duganella callida]
MSKVCQYFFSAQSPWAYLGHERLVTMARKHGVQIEIKPCDLANVFDASGGLPLAKRAPQRQAYRLVELARWSAYLDLPLQLHPPFFPVAPDLANRLIVATRQAHGTEQALALSGAIMRGVWADEKNIADEVTLARIAGGCGLDGAALLKAVESAAVKAEYENNTAQAHAASVFGSPWYVLDGENFWGQDRLDFLERAMQK